MAAHDPCTLTDEAWPADRSGVSTQQLGGPVQSRGPAQPGPAEQAGTAALLVASNRGPVAFTRDDAGTLIGRRGSGGLVAGLSALGRGATWICAALSEADRAVARGHLYDHPSAGAPRVRMLDIDPEVHDRAYSTVANRTLWFVHHLLFDVPRAPSFGPAFDEDWRAYRRYNEIFADALAAEAAPGATVLVQDYHLALAPQLVRRRRPDVRIAHFSHTPWAPPEYLRLLPDAILSEYLRGLLGADRLAFLSARWASAFLAGCAAVLGDEVRVGERRDRIELDGRVVRIGVHPLGVDVDDLRTRADRPDVRKHRDELTRLVGGRTVLLRVDRAELSKNILRGLDAYAELLRRRPDLHGELVHLAFVCPSRSDVPEYRTYLTEVRRRAEAIVAEFGRPDWMPLHLEVRDDVARSLAAYQLADIVVTNPVRDGMNLVAKEAPVLSERSAVLVLSREAGAADELGSAALLVNPFDVGATADALEQALAMDAAERSARSASLVAAAGACPPSQWLREQVEALG